jgi:hypothetical protein
MPNEHGQVTTEDLKALTGKFRIISENMADGELRIIADINHVECAFEIANILIRDDQDGNFFFTIWNDQGKEIEIPDPDDSEVDEQENPEDGNPPWE